ncbi:ABC transporter ATP-binding protein [Vibrio panuliri]|uniref:ABC transporter ATP-binding protein n=1 Tax=Vibrio panuliri TaxID=1381081 RepID=A0A1Q9HAV8_9VIBR|nr:ATP-binding cassette domain-containing protein [Vibrio panuliri]OLQ86310.1 ABC transporter ATP-binding protein [Vibrio panuliri]
MTIVVKDVHFDYGKVAVLKSVSCTLETGFNVLLGPNGAGKSTLFSLLTGLSPIQKGEIGYGQLSLNHNRPKVLSQLGAVFQQSTLDLDLTVKQNLIYHASLHGLHIDSALKNIKDMLCDLQISERLNDRVRTLNGGHRRRLEIVRAMMHKPHYLLLDEPTVGLDNESRNLILSHIRNLATQHGLCVLWMTHLMDEVSLEDSLIVLNRGHVKAKGRAQTLCETHGVRDVHQLYRKLTDCVGLA